MVRKAAALSQEIKNPSRSCEQEGLLGSQGPIPDPALGAVQPPAFRRPSAGRSAAPPAAPKLRAAGREDPHPLMRSQDLLARLSARPGPALRSDPVTIRSDPDQQERKEEVVENHGKTIGNHHSLGKSGSSDMLFNKEKTSRLNISEVRGPCWPCCFNRAGCAGFECPPSSDESSASRKAQTRAKEVTSVEICMGRNLYGMPLSYPVWGSLMLTV